MLKGKNALVTGSTSGIGLGIARALAEQGCNLMMNGFGDPAPIERNRAALAEAADVTVLYSGADMTLPAEISRLVADTARRLGGIDILVNCAGIQHTAAVEEFPPEK